MVGHLAVGLRRARGRVQPAAVVGVRRLNGLVHRQSPSLAARWHRIDTLTPVVRTDPVNEHLVFSRWTPGGSRMRGLVRLSALLWLLFSHATGALIAFDSLWLVGLFAMAATLVICAAAGECALLRVCDQNRAHVLGYAGLLAVWASSLFLVRGPALVTGLAALGLYVITAELAAWQHRVPDAAWSAG